MTKKPYNPLICAIDVKETAMALELCRKIKPAVGLIKLGLEFFTVNGAQGVRAVKESGVPLFLDLKFHDIPNTVAEAVRSAVRLGVDMLTVHTAGGRAMMQAAAVAAEDEAKHLGIKAPLILGVTVLTSMDEADLKSVGVAQTVAAQVEALAKLAQESGLNGVICSPLEIKIIRQACGGDFKLIVPGIRPEGSASNDQKRVMTPKQAIDEGADFIVVGRPITGSPDSAGAAQAIAREVFDC